MPHYATDELLGLVRFCLGCGEWWPDDDEFWDGAKVCRACILERRERRRAQVRTAVRRLKERRACRP